MNAEALVISEMEGREPIVKDAVEPGATVLQTPATGLQTLRMTVALVAVLNGRLGVLAGTTIARLICEESVTVAVRAALVVNAPETEIPTWVAMLGSWLWMNPVPVRVRFTVVPGTAVGTLDGQIEVRVGVGDPTITLNATTLVTAGLPQTMVAIPVS